MSYKVSVDGKVIGAVVDLPGMTLIGSALELAGSNSTQQSRDAFPPHGPKRVSINGTTIEIETWNES